MLRWWLLVGLLVSPALAGCIYREPGPREVEGEVVGYAPTSSFLKVEVETDSGSVFLVFDRRDWSVRELADMVDHRELRALKAAGQERNTLGEVAALSFVTPEELNRLRFRAEPSAQERRALDAEWAAWLEAWAARPDAPSVPGALLPVHPM